MLELLRELRKHVVIGFVGGSNLSKIEEQVNVQDFDFGFAENGLVAFRMGQQLKSESFIEWIGEDKYKSLAKFCLHYIAELDLPKMRYGSCSISVALMPIAHACQRQWYLH